MLQFAHTAYTPDKITVRNGECIMNARVAVVTGASRGIGKEIAAKLAAEGCHLIRVCIAAFKALRYRLQNRDR